VGDQAAGRFAQVFYEKLLAGATLAEAVRIARLQVRDDFPGNPAWLAYTLFADPLARVGRRAPLT
jgi:CHAT domain-containing protein